MTVESKSNTNLKMHNTKVVQSGCEVNLLYARCVYLFQDRFTRNFSVNTSRKMDNMRTGTEIVNPCIYYDSCGFLSNELEIRIFPKFS